MIISIDQTEHRVPITILSVQGNLDGSNYLQLISKAHELYNSGMRNLILDMSEIPFMSSSGILALHTIALLLRDERLPELENGWAALRNVADENSGFQQHVKLVNPQARVYKTLAITGMNNFFEIFDALDLAVASF
jgi:anti-anti-sigma regulatory factor